jgi:hypothetical protein
MRTDDSFESPSLPLAYHQRLDMLQIESMTAHLDQMVIHLLPWISSWERTKMKMIDDVDEKLMKYIWYGRPRL